MEHFEEIKMRIAPNFVDGEQFESVTLPPNPIRQSVSSKEPKSYLIIGFDTEYQTPPPFIKGDSRDLKKGELQYEVLSYQFSCEIVSPPNDFEDFQLEDDVWENIASALNIDPQRPLSNSLPNKQISFGWEGIIVKEDDEDRISLKDFVRFAVGKGLKEYPFLTIPKNVLLVAHFTRADIPAFDEFADPETRWDLNLMNIRNTFVGDNRSIKVPIGEDDLKVVVRDTITLAPAGAKSLLKLGEITGFEKIVLDADPKKEKHIKENMKQFRRDNWELFREYAIRDALVCTKYTKDIMNQYFADTGKFKMPVTLTSIGVDLLKQYWKDQKWDWVELCGKEKNPEKIWSNKSNRYTPPKEKYIYLKSLHYHLNVAIESYHGGRNEQFWFGEGFEGDWTDYDLTSAYPSAMGLIGKPNWEHIEYFKDVETIDQLESTDLGFADVTFKFPRKVRFPCLPIRTMNGLVFPREGESNASIAELKLARKLGCHIKVREGRYVPTDKSQRVFEGFIKDCIDKRNLHPKKSFQNLYWKEIANSTYGKTAQGLRERRLFDLKALENVPLKQSDVTNPFFASFITGFVRGVLAEIMNALPETSSIFSVTTDGFLTTATIDEMNNASKGELCREYSKSGLRLRNNADVYEIKHKIRKPLGWRTRGQATITASNQMPNPDDNYVLAKGGIFLTDKFEKTEQNDEVVKLFFERTNQHKLTKDTMLGLREMVLYGNDPIDISIEKVLSMEFDWKRQPFVSTEKVPPSHIGCDEERLVFSTKPWDTQKQFTDIRNLWWEYNKEEKKILLTLDDFNQFADWVESKLSMDPESKRYLPKENTIEKRIRNEVMNARRFRKAGTHTYKNSVRGLGDNQYKKNSLTQKDIIACWGLMGIECSVDDLKNANRKKHFIPHRVPRSKKSFEILEKVRDNMFPQIDIHQFLSNPSGVKLSERQIDSDPFVQRLLDE